MLKTHEKSRIYPVRGSYAAEEIKEVVLQMEPTQLQSNGNYIYLVETVSREEYNRTTAEGRAAAAEEELAAEIEAHEIEMNEAQAKIDALEELLAQTRTEKAEIRDNWAKTSEDLRTLHRALIECKRVFNGLPAEIEEKMENIGGDYVL